MKKSLGLDVGIASVGWGIVDEDNNIVDQGVRLFEELNVDGNVTRRGMRGSRRLTRRRKQRILDMKFLLVKNNIISEDFESNLNPYILRKKGLNEKLTNNELATVLLNFAKRRGSSLEVVEEQTASNETGTKAILSKNASALKEAKYIVNAQLARFKESGQIRGTDNNYKTEDYLNELEAILENQNLSKEMNEQIIEIVKRRRHFSEGPGSYNSPSPYGRYREVTGEEKNAIIEEIKKHYKGLYLKENFEINHEGKAYNVFKNGMIVNKEKYDLIALMRGKCSIYPDELRAPKNAFSAELFNLLNDLNNLKVVNRENEKITKEEKELIIKHIREKGGITVNQLLKILKAELTDVTGFRIDNNDKPLLSEFKGYKKVLKIMKDNDYPMLKDEVIDEVMVILTETVIKEERINKISKIVEDETIVNELSLLTGISQYHNLSLKAIYLLNNEMLNEPLNQQQIITNMGLKEERKITKLVADESAILSPTAKRAHREALKVVDELIKEHGNFDKIIIETTREKNSDEVRKNKRDRQKYFENARKEAEDIIGDYGAENINSSNILKVRLYKEQEGKCAYSGKTIDLAQLIRDPKSYEIDHIIPFSISYDDSHNNKVLTLPLVNQDKGNRTPFGYFTSGKSNKENPINSWEKFEANVLNNNNYSRIKKQNLLFMQDINKYDVLKEFINRNIVDTSYAVRSLMRTLKDYFRYNDIDTKVLTIKGKQTNLFRKLGANLWNRENNYDYDNNPFNKDRDQYIHHALDALIIAGLSNQKTIRKLYNLTLSKENTIYERKTGEVLDYENPTEDNKFILFLKELSKLKESDVKYSWKIDTKPNRKVSDQTIYSTRLVDDEHIVIKKISDIYEMKKEDIYEYLYGKKQGKLLVSKHDLKTFDILKSIYQQYQHEKYPFKSFYDEHGYIRKYSKKGNGPIIKQLKYEEDRLGNYIDITPKDAKDKKVVLLQISPYRADVYYSEKEARYKFVTIRYNNVYKQRKNYMIDEKWYEAAKKEKGINYSYTFKFSLYRNNIIKMKTDYRNNKTEITHRFITVNNDFENRFETKPIDYYERKRIRKSIGPSIKSLEKYNVSVTGKISKVEHEDLKLIF